MKTFFQVLEYIVEVKNKNIHFSNTLFSTNVMVIAHSGRVKVSRMARQGIPLPPDSKFEKIPELSGAAANGSHYFARILDRGMNANQ